MTKADMIEERRQLAAQWEARLAHYAAAKADFWEKEQERQSIQRGALAEYEHAIEQLDPRQDWKQIKALRDQCVAHLDALTLGCSPEQAVAVATLLEVD